MSCILSSRRVTTESILPIIVKFCHDYWQTSELYFLGEIQFKNTGLCKNNLHVFVYIYILLCILLYMIYNTYICYIKCMMLVRGAPLSHQSLIKEDSCHLHLIKSVLITLCALDNSLARMGSLNNQLAQFW